MEFAEMLRNENAHAFAALSTFDAEAALTFGRSPKQVREWERLARTYYGNGKHVHGHGEARRAVREQVIAGGFSLEQLALVERKLQMLDDEGSKWALRAKLLAARCSYAALERKAKKLVPTKKKAPTPGVRVSRSIEGLRSISIVGPERDIADFEHTLREGIDENSAASPQMLSRFLSMLRSGGEDAQGSGAQGFGVPTTRPRPLLLIPLPEWVKILRGEGDDTVLGLSDDTTMTATEFINEFIATGEFELEAATFHPVHGPVNLHRASRYANEKQRDLLRALMPVCPVPGCKHGADSCQFHHIKAWKNGGETNIDNLTPLCSYHNKINDDSPSSPGETGARPRRKSRRQTGKIISRGTIPTWESPGGYAVPNLQHANYRYGAMFSLFGGPMDTH
ncbi:HNH endonuclease signature motif containing protein [Corynebacterium aquatimens]|uniref:HNH nuclease domain-containing protein n=1 Tax=Corynebacterium aquatimens TaxID=1190508 RepID=A0A931E0R1_9CORY|nr:HNH endonuclease signature motif containing protein [Corynebacterium aquatimens]MBG6121626.1 hypothetical protein [Corynebacterium aquatimens]